MTITESIKKLIQKALSDLHFKVEEIALEHPENAEHGDYSTNVALVLAKKLGKNPREIADRIISNFKIRNSKFLDNVEVAGPGFINFFVSSSYLIKELGKIAREKEKYGTGREKKKVIVEFTDPNPFKEFHLGHLYSNTVGESLCRLFEATGAVVKRANYQGDVGMHVAKAILGMQIRIETERQKPSDNDPSSKKAQWLGRCYALGSGGDPSVWGYAMEGSRELFDKQIKMRNERVETGELERINQAVYERSDPVINALYIMGRKWSLEYFEKIYKRLGTKFDYYYFESKVGTIGKTIVEEGLRKGVFERSQGAVIFPGEKYDHGLHSRVFINALGLPTYEAKELGLAPTKYKDFKYDLSVIVTGNEITDYFKVVLEAMQQMYSELKAKTRHITHGMVRLPEGKMSSRAGKIITAEDLLDEVRLRVLKVMETSTNVFSKKDREETAEIIAVGAVKYSRLRVSLSKDIIFDFDRSLSLGGESGPYLQYTYARCKSILHKSKVKSSLLHSNRVFTQKLSFAKLSKEEGALLRLLYRFEEVVREAAEKFSPNLVCNFVFDVAQRYNLFYNTNPVLQAETKELKDLRLLLTAATAQIIKNSLSLLGIDTPERM